MKHPGSRLERLLRKHGVTAYRCATDIGVPKPRIYELAKSQGSVTPPLALRLGRYFGDGAEVWMAEQARYDLALQERALRRKLNAISPIGEERDDNATPR